MHRPLHSLSFVLLFVALQLSVTAQQVCDSVFTPCFNTTSGTGFFLDLEASTDVTIEGFSTMSQGAGTRDVELYYRPGGFVGYETDAAAWTLAGSASGFDPVSAISCPIPVTPLPITFNVCIPAGERYGFTSPARAVPVPLNCTIRSRPGPCSRTTVRCVCTSAKAPLLSEHSPDLSRRTNSCRVRSSIPAAARPDCSIHRLHRTCACSLPS